LASEPVEPGKVMPTYSGFVILRLNEIWATWRADDPEGALKSALFFAENLTPKKIKKKLKHEVEVIKKDLNKAYRTQGVDFFTTHVARNRATRRVAIYYLGPFLSKLSDLLDEWGYYEVPSRRLKPSDFKGLEKHEG
jgi:hypothetical protein